MRGGLAFARYWIMSGCLMKLSRAHRTLAVIAVAITAALLVHGPDPAKAAKLKCKQHLAQVAGSELSDDEVAAMRVTGDEHNGKVQGALLRGNQLHYLACEFEHDETKRAEVDGMAWPDAARDGIERAKTRHPVGGGLSGA